MKFTAITWIILAVLVIFAVNALFSMQPLKTTEKKKNGAVTYRSLSAEDGWAMLQSNKKVLLLDVRTPDEYTDGHLPDSKNLPSDKMLKMDLPKKLGNRNKTILVYCQSGTRSKQATKLLYLKGFTDVYDIGGMSAFYKRKPQETTQTVS